VDWITAKGSIAQWRIGSENHLRLRMFKTWARTLFFCGRLWKSVLQRLKPLEEAFSKPPGITLCSLETIVEFFYRTLSGREPQP
jgi:hypothetical protein